MKDKNVAALLAFFLGWLGVHRFYLGQIGLGVFYLIFMPIGIVLSIIDFIAFLSMDQEVFDVKYNRNIPLADHRRYDTDFDRNRRRSREERDERRRERARERETYRQDRRPPSKSRTPEVLPNPFKQSGIRKYKDFDYERAIEDFNKALTVNAKDVAVHFNLACAYSLTEEKEKAFFHLSKAVEYGFVDYSRINTHDALAFLRIQEEFDTFVQNGYRMLSTTPQPIISNEETIQPTIDSNHNLLEQLKQLGELKEKGLLTEEEFVAQKKRLLG